MEYNNPQTQDGTGAELIEDISKIQGFALGVGPVVCQVCGCELREGDGVTAYAFRAAGNLIFEIGYVMCGADEHAHPSVFMRGVHELVVTGRIGLCSDVATQSSWLVLLAPELIVESGPAESFAHVIGEGATRGSDSCVQSYRGSPEDGPVPLVERVRECGSSRVERSGDYSQGSGAYTTEDDVECGARLTEQGGDE